MCVARPPRIPVRAVASSDACEDCRLAQVAIRCEGRALARTIEFSITCTPPGASRLQPAHAAADALGDRSEGDGAARFSAWTVFCVSTAISIGALMIATLTLHRVWVMTRNHPRHAFAHVHELQQSGLVPMTYAPMATARVEFPARSESLKHVDASKEGDNESDRANLL
jgi:hypothetical protein